MDSIKVIQNVEVLDLVSFIHKKKKLHQKILLNGIEDVMGTDHPDYSKIRKLILDNTNDLARSIIRAVFGDDFEGIIK